MGLGFKGLGVRGEWVHPALTSRWMWPAACRRTSARATSASTRTMSTLFTTALLRSEWPMNRGLHSFRFQLNLSSSVHRVTQLNPECVLELLKLSSNVNECKLLPMNSITMYSLPHDQGQTRLSRSTSSRMFAQYHHQ